MALVAVFDDSTSGGIHTLDLRKPSHRTALRNVWPYSAIPSAPFQAFSTV